MWREHVLPLVLTRTNDMKTHIRFLAALAAALFLGMLSSAPSLAADPAVNTGNGALFPPPVCPPNTSCAPPSAPSPTAEPPRTCGPNPGGSTCGGSGPAGQGNSSGTNQGAGNPINVINGNKYQVETDMPALPGVLGLELVRYYNSSWRALGYIGYGWHLSYETDLFVVGNTVQIHQADGAALIFNRDPKNSSSCSTTNPANGRIQIRSTPRGEEFVWIWTNGRRLAFSSQGKLESITAPTGEFLTLQYGPKAELLKVTDPQGRSLNMEYAKANTTGFKGIVAIQSPLGRFELQHNNDLKHPGLGNLVSVNAPQVVTPGATLSNTSSAIRRYHYGADSGEASPNLAHHLTGISLQGQDAQGKPNLQRLNTWAYDINGRGILSVKGLPRQTDAKGRTIPGTGIEQINLDFRKSGQTVLTNSLGQVTTYIHANVAQTFRLMEVRGAGCVSCGPSDIRYGYDKLGRLTEETTLTQSGQPELTTKTELDSLGRVVRVSTIGYPGGKAQAPQQKLRYEYAGDGSQPTLVARPSVVAGKEHVIRIAYNSAGQPTSVTEEGYNPLGSKGAASATQITRSTTYKYQVVNGRSLLVESDGPLANGPKGTPEDSDITRYMWNAHGDAVTQIVYPMGLTAKLQYDNEGNPSGSRRITQYTGIDGVVTKLTYNSAGVLAMVDRAGVVTRYAVDAHNRVTQVLSASGERMDMAYDLAGHLAAIADPQNNRIQLQRNLEGELSQAQLLNPDGTAAQQAIRYNDDHTNTQGANPRGKDAVLAGVRQLIESAQASSNVARPDVSPAPVAQLLTRWQQEASQAPVRTATTSAVDVQGLVTTYLRNDFGELLRVLSPVTGTTDYRYNSAGQLLARVQQDGSQAVYQRDAAGRVVAVKATDSTGVVDEDAHITWGAANKPSHIQYVAGDERFAYDAAGRLTQHSQTIDGQQFILRYAFNTAGQLVAKTLPDGQVLAYRYRGSLHPRAGLLESVWLQSGGLKSGFGLLDRPVVQGLNDEKDSYTQRRFSYGNGLTNEFRLDAYGRVISAGNAQVGLAELRYGDMGPPTHAEQERRNSEPEQVTTQRPVVLGQQAQEQAARTLISQLKGGSTQWLGSPRDELTRSLELPDIQRDFNSDHFDTLGRQTSQGLDRYSYDSLGRLTQLKRLRVLGAGEEQAVASYRYNLFGQRIAKTVARTDGKGSKTTYYFYDGSQLVAETSDEGTARSQYIWLNDKPVGLLKSDHLYAVHTDHRNAPLAVTDEARTVVWQAQVADYLLSSPVQGGQLGQVEFNLRGSNQYFDAESGLHYNTNRYFDPVAQRYLSPDPMGLAVGLDLYAFALNRPHGVSDPLGLAPVSNPGGSLAGWTYEDKLKEIVTRAIPLLPTEIGAALQEMVQPASLAIMGAVLAGFIAIQATPFGWIADAALLGYGAWMIGSGITELLRTLINLHNDTNNARCEADLQAAAVRLAKGFVTSTGEVVGGLAGVWGARTGGGLTRIANGIKTLLEYGKRNFGPRGPIVVSGNTGTSVGTSALTPGLGGTITQAQMPRPFAWGQRPYYTRFQGGPWEVKIESLIRGSVRFLKSNFRAFDHYVETSLGRYRMISAKTLDTSAPTYQTPSAIASTIRTFVNDTLNFVTDTDPGLRLTINRSQIASREIQLAIPSTTNAAQWAAIRTEIAAAAARGVDIIVTVITP